MERNDIVKALHDINERLEAGWKCDMYGAVELAQEKLNDLINEMEKEDS
jgi:hypothetical protein